MNSLFEYIMGYTEFEIISADTAKFITECASEKIHLHNISKQENFTLRFTVYNYQMEEFITITKKYSLQYRIIKSNSLIFTLKKLLKRKFFLIGFTIFIVAIFSTTSFISEINIKGNEKLSEQEILKILEQHGFKKGISVYNIDKKRIQQDIIKDSGEFSWMWIDIKGTVANVTVKEKIHIPEMTDYSDYSNCIASNDAQIIEVMPRYGKQMVFPGDVVKKGDLLISGISETKTDKIRYIHADGIIMAKTWYSLTGEYNHTRYDRYLTGDSKKRYNINIMGYDMPVSFNGQLYDKYDKKEKVKKIPGFLNFSFTISTYYEIMEKSVTINDKEVVESAVHVLKQELYESLKSKKDLTVNNITYDYYENESGNIVVTVNFECIEDIAQYQQICKPEYYTEEINGENSDV